MKCNFIPFATVLQVRSLEFSAPIPADHKMGITLFNVSVNLIDWLISPKFKVTRPVKISAIFFSNLPLPSSLNPVDKITIVRQEKVRLLQSF